MMRKLGMVGLAAAILVGSGGEVLTPQVAMVQVAGPFDVFKCLINPCAPGCKKDNCSYRAN